MTGFEPATLCSQSICATKLRYIPFSYQYPFTLLLTYYHKAMIDIVCLTMLYLIPPGEFESPFSP